MIYLLLSLACAQTTPLEPTLPPPTEDVQMTTRLILNSTADLADIQNRIRESQSPQSFVIAFGPDPFQNAIIRLGDAFSSVRHTFEIQGEQALLQNSSLTIIGEKITVNGLRFLGSPTSGPPLQIQGVESISLTKVFIGELSSPQQKRGSQPRGGALQIRALKDGTSAVFDQVTLMNSPQPIQIVAKTGARFGSVQIKSLRLHNVSSPAVVLGPVQTVHVENVQQTTKSKWIAPSTLLTFVEGKAEVMEADEALLTKWKNGHW